MSRAHLDRRLPVGRAVLAQTMMELRLLVRSGESLLVTFGIPLGVLVFLSSVDVVPTGEGPAVDFLVPGVLAISTAATGMVAVAIQTAFERKYGVLKRIGGTPLPRVAFLTAKGLAVGALLAAQTALTLGIAAGFLGWRLPAPTGTGMAFGVVALGAVTMTAIGLLMAGTMRAEATLALSNALFLVLLLISGVTFDAEVLPDRVAALGQLLPVGAMGEALRSVFAGTLPAVELAILAMWGVGAVALAARTFRWDP